MVKFNKYKIVFKYNEPEYIFATDKEDAIYDWKENNNTIQMRGKGCDKIISCELEKEYTDEEWEIHLDEIHQESCNTLLYSMPDCYEEKDNGNIVYIGINKSNYGKVIKNRYKRNE